jgi:Rrf2 family protein
MVISARVHYACLAMLELAIRGRESTPVAAAEIAQRHGVPGPFLVQILRTLRAAGWVQSTRGSQGGYRLSIDPARVTLLDIAEAVGCQEAGCHTEGGATPADDLLQEFWDQAADAWRQILGRARLSDLVERCRHGEATMFYI